MNRLAVPGPVQVSRPVEVLVKDPIWVVFLSKRSVGHAVAALDQVAVGIFRPPIQLIAQLFPLKLSKFQNLAVIVNIIYACVPLNLRPTQSRRNFSDEHAKSGRKVVQYREILAKRLIF